MAAVLAGRRRADEGQFRQSSGRQFRSAGRALEAVHGRAHNSAMSGVLELGLKLPEPGSRHVRRALHAQLRAAILDGRLAAGLQLPASRTLATDLGLSRNTVTAVYDTLLSEGLITTRPGAGAFVGGRAAASAALREAPAAVRFDLRPGLPDSTSFPFDIWGRLTGRALRHFSRAPSGYREPAGHPSLREAIAGHLSFARGLACRAEDIVVTVGAQQAFDLIARTAAGRVVAVEDPGYPATRAAFAAAGAEVRAVPVDGEGLIVDALPAEAAVVCVTPAQQFPMGVAMSEARRAALLDVARRSGALVVEDDYGGEFRFEGPARPPLFAQDPARVAYVGTFSQSLLPALRIGFVVATSPLREALAEARALSDWHGPAIEHAALAAFIAEGHLARHVRRMRRVYAARRAAMLAALGGCEALEVVPSSAGLHVTARLKDGDAAAVATRALAAGLRVETLAPFAAERPTAQGFALGYGLIEAEEIPAAIGLLAEAIG